MSLDTDQIRHDIFCASLLLLPGLIGGSYGYSTAKVEGCVDYIPKLDGSRDYRSNPGWEVLDKNTTYYTESVDGEMVSFPAIKVKKPPEDCKGVNSELDQRVGDATFYALIVYLAIILAIFIAIALGDLKARYTVSEGKTETGDNGGR